MEREQDFPPDTLASSRYVNDRRAQTSLTPEKRLMLALLKDAIFCFQEHHAAWQGKRRKKFNNVRNWFFDPGDDWVFSFDNVCSALALDPQYIRSGLVLWLKRNSTTPSPAQLGRKLRKVNAMKTNSLKFCCVSLAVVSALLIGSSALEAIDNNNRSVAYGVGQRSCDDYVKFREKKLEALEKQHERYTKDELYEIVDRIVEHWIAGFLTAHNLYVSDTYDVAGKSSINDLEGRLEQSCRQNPKQRFAEAMISVVQQLNPQRVRAEGAK